MRVGTSVLGGGIHTSEVAPPGPSHSASSTVAFAVTSVIVTSGYT